MYCYRYCYFGGNNIFSDACKNSVLQSVKNQGYWDNELHDVELISIEEMEKLVPIKYQHYFKEYTLPILIKKILKGHVL